MGNSCGGRCLSGSLLLSRNEDDIRRHYRIGRVLGSGSFGQVRECTRRETGEVFAVKIIERKMTAKEQMAPGRPSNEAMIKSEVNILKDLDHPNVVKYVDFFEDRHFFYAVLELCDGGELFHEIVKRRHVTEQDASNFCKQMVGALAYLHERGIVHRDVKAENFLFKSKSPDSLIKLIDFGMSAKIPPCGYLTDLCGSPHYISPELISKHYGTGVDMWAFGVMIYLMLFGRYPFEGAKPGHIAREVQHKQLDWTSKECMHLTESCVDFLSRLLDRNYRTRLTAAQALQHPWISTCTPLKELSIINPENLELARRLNSGKGKALDAESLSPTANSRSTLSNFSSADSFVQMSARSQRFLARDQSMRSPLLRVQVGAPHQPASSGNEEIRTPAADGFREVCGGRMNAV
ncbi:ULK kinase [Toxoplasma gondii]|uniref:non-specific serine/threonine protein kinase n=3 Tax=Toxoplasma gondii TaxID=5811 RepID=A0A7J6JZC2_TOXGO|nr:ULK kinase [Toxoplasma gondii]